VSGTIGSIGTVSEKADPQTGCVAFIGGGFMGEGILQGLLARGASVAGDVAVCEPLRLRREYLARQYGVRTSEQAADVLDEAQTVIFAVKPQDFATAAAGVASFLRPEQVALSIMAGVRIETLRTLLRHERIVRAMPNTPGAIGEGFTGWTATTAVQPAELVAVEAILGTLGRTAHLPDEKYLDMVTAVSGSGPGFVMLLAEAMIDAAVLIGLRRDLATEMVLQTFAGSARWAQQSGRHVAELRNAVTSSAGTTAAGLQELERSGVRAALSDAVVAAYERSCALGG